MKRIFKNLRAIGMLVSIVVATSGIVFAQKVATVDERGRITAAEALRRYEKLLEAATDPYERYYLTMKIAPVAFAAGDNVKAKAYSLDLALQASTDDHVAYNGDAVHIANIVLGMVALADGDVTEATRRLLDAGKSKGSPPLNTFGPDMRLAKELLAKGERDVVIKYFELCAKFWKMGLDDLSDWKALVIDGRIPRFGPNLTYILDIWHLENWYKYGY